MCTFVQNGLVTGMEIIVLRDRRQSRINYFGDPVRKFFGWWAQLITKKNITSIKYAKTLVFHCI